jgi:hypothetical protein
MSPVSSDSVARVLVRVSSNQQPHLRRHCPRCAAERSFASSGKFRVNAQRKTIDAWLIFRCTDCDTRWNLPIHERRPVKAIDPIELEALMRNDAALAGRYAAANAASGDVDIAVRFATPMHPETQVIEITIAVAPSCIIRLDRLLASVLGLRRDEIEMLHDGAMLSITPSSRKVLRRSAIDGQTIRLDLAGCPDGLATRLNIPASDRPG